MLYALMLNAVELKELELQIKHVDALGFHYSTSLNENVIVVIRP